MTVTRRTAWWGLTLAHLKDDGRFVVIFCAFEDKPLILRLYGLPGLGAPSV